MNCGLSLWGKYAKNLTEPNMPCSFVSSLTSAIFLIIFVTYAL